ncbi:tetratricopeptide repeat protein 6 [Protopterus annectens]|uniref:tetratricopeptide repeat protein 6 n=1 Tax=Protopterus annectens TaxID=7888 RepID=UPI001CFA989B|nr:tetratricopeptide repeat protein 6 [Protopterus annectens]
MPAIYISRATKVWKLSTNFQTTMKELELLRKQITHPKTEMEPKEIFLIDPLERPSKENLPETVVQLKEETHLKVAVHQNEQRHWPVKISPAEEARKAGKKYVTFPKTKKKKKSKKSLDAKKIDALREKLNQQARVLKRCESLPRLSINIEPYLKVQSKMLQKSPSMPDVLDFKKFSKDHGGIPENTVIREWVRDIWNMWFDEVFPPSRASNDDGIEKIELFTSEHQQPQAEEKLNVEIQLTDTFSPVLIDESKVCVEEILNEVKHLTTLIEERPNCAAFHYCRRGALNRILGNAKMAMEDLNKAIRMEPMLLDSYWHRHLLYLLQSKDTYALDDLNFIIKHNKHHADAYQSKAEIYRRKGDITMAIISYTQAIKCNPTDESYFKRGEMYEKRNEVLLAMEDYAMVFAINPKRTDALMRHGLHHFENSNWTGAVQDFSSLIKHDHNNAVARTYRGRAYANLMQYREATEDFSAAVHLDPNNWIAFYYRGCLLRKTNSARALQDLSVSVLLNDTYENLNAFLQRGILYTDVQQWPEAVCDFDNVLMLDRTVAVAHVNLGLIFMLKMDHYYEALRRFTDAIKVSPTYSRAYICRAQAYHKLHDLQKALRDLTRAIHLQPDNHQLYIMRGQYLFEMKKFELASFCIHHAAEINQALNASPVQQALVHSFCQNYSKATESLVSATGARPNASLFALLGKTQMKAKKSKEAIQSFEQALHLLTEDNAKPSGSEVAEIFYLIGLCYVEQVHLLKALDAFTNAVKIFPDHADAYYQRGLCKMRLKQVKCIQDFNRALTCNPNLFQAYLSRAAFYGIKGLYTKAILNCSEALRIQPKSVRAYLYRGALKYYIKAYIYAIEDLTAAINLEKACTLAYYNRAVCYHQTKDFNKALKDYGIVLLLGGRKEIDLKVCINRGLLYLELNQYFSALQDFASAVMKSPEESVICHAVGICHHRLEEFEKAVDAFSQALKLNPFCVDSCVGRGNSYMEYGHESGTKQAQKDFLRALHLDPRCLKARINMGYNLQVLGEFQKAWNQFTVALDIDAKCQAAYEGRAIVNLQMSHTLAAFHDISAALKLGVSAKLLTNRGVIHQFMGDLHNAMKDYQAAIRIDPSYSLAYFNAANIYFYSKQFHQARDHYTSAISLDPRNESAVLNRAITHSLLQDSHKALEDFIQAVKLSPYSSHIYFNRANLYKALKQYELAEKDYSQALALQPNDALVYKFRADVRGKLGLKEDAISDYKCAIYIQETVKSK